MPPKRIRNILVGTLLFCLAGLAEAVPVRTENYPAVSITDKQTTEKLVMDEHTLVYSRNGKTIWRKTLSRDDVFYDVDFVDSGILVLMNYTKCESGASKFLKSGSLLWQKCNMYGGELGPSVNRKLLEHGILALNSREGEPHFRIYRTFDLSNGKQIPINGEPLEYFEDRILSDITTYDVTNSAYEPENSLPAMYNVGFKTFSTAGIPDPYDFPTPPRPNCNSYDHMFYPFILSNLRDAQIFTRSKASGEYIYAHRADGCGQFTYRFHWTDPAHPDPEILPGWQ
jgi:hypothetical protein